MASLPRPLPGMLLPRSMSKRRAIAAINATGQAAFLARYGRHNIILMPAREASSTSRSSTPTRSLHSSPTQSSPSSNFTLSEVLPNHQRNRRQPQDAEMGSPKPAPLSVLPLLTVLRSWMTATISSSPFLLPPSLAIMSMLAHTSNPVLNPDSNPLLRALLKETFYAQFCAGEQPAEVARTIKGLKDVGFEGVILGYAREVVAPHSHEAAPGSVSKEPQETAVDVEEIDSWAQGTLMTVLLAGRGDYVALKFTGAGVLALQCLRQGADPSANLKQAIDSICVLAQSRGVRLLFDAEQAAVQGGIDKWTLEFMERYNQTQPVVYGTYQAYLKSAPETLSRHLREANRKSFVLGVKLVRGAYLGSDPRQLIHDTKEDTDRAFDGIAESLLKKDWEAGPLKGEGGFPEVAMVVATHNRDSVIKAKRILQQEQKTSDVAFAQLQGMADEVSCELVASNRQGTTEKQEKAKAYKYLVWGSTGECMKYLLRRAYENRDAVQRTVGSRDAMRAEVMRRLKSLFGFA
ncbi:FAD-linked oxidoreductase-like protein [Triangularia verruculosa]|uniref:Proline dehydrogenase n=1 Tax=Triangularia verruculosa TaxID=2587418 RepID=A0AAN6XLH0_9PEZI|nr:FAD-linked oxidoreductase-like protein [Triangularia verruculosa]